MRLYRRSKTAYTAGHIRPSESKGIAITARLGVVICTSDRCSWSQIGRRDREGRCRSAVGSGHLRTSSVRMRANVSARGAHALSCSLGFGCQAIHSNINDLIHRSLNRAGIPAIKEPSGLTRSDGKRPDGQTLIPWSGGRTLLWDATVIDTVATSYIQETAAAAGGAAEIAAARKHAKYKEL